MAEFRFTEQELKFLTKKVVRVPAEWTKTIYIEIENEDKEFEHEFVIVVIPMDASAVPDANITIRGE